MSWVDVIKTKTPQQVSSKKLLVIQTTKIFEKTDVYEEPILDMNKVESVVSCLRYDSIKNKINVLLNPKNKSNQNISKTKFEDNIFEAFCGLIANYDSDICDFLKELLQTGHFYIGGSFATMFAHLLLGENLDMKMYSDSDIDIYCISNLNVRDLDIIFKNKLNKLLENKKCIVYKTGVLANIIFADINFRKIQVIFQVKQSIDEHLAFIDIPVTEFTLGYEKNTFIMYYTQLSLLGLFKKVNIMFEPISEITNNRIIKYSNRNFIHIVVDKEEVKYFDLDYENLCSVNLVIDYLEFINLFEEYKKKIFSNHTFPDFSPFNIEKKSKIDIQESSVSNYPNTNIFKFLFEKQTIDFVVTEKNFERKIQKKKLIERRRIYGYWANLYETITIVKKVLQIKKRVKSVLGRKYLYIDDEKNHTFENMTKSDFVEKIIYNPKKVNKIAQESLYFSHKVSSFLKKQGVFLIDDLFLTKDEYYNYVCSKKNINILQEEDTEDFDFKSNRKKIFSNSKKYKKK